MWPPSQHTQMVCVRDLWVIPHGARMRFPAGARRFVSVGCRQVRDRIPIPQGTCTGPSRLSHTRPVCSTLVSRKNGGFQDWWYSRQLPQAPCQEIHMYSSNGQCHVQNTSVHSQHIFHWEQSETTGVLMQMAQHCRTHSVWSDAA